MASVLDKYSCDDVGISSGVDLNPHRRCIILCVRACNATTYCLHVRVHGFALVVLRCIAETANAGAAGWG